MSSTAESLASRLRQMRRRDRARAGDVDSTARELIIVAFAVPIVAVAAIALVVLAVLLLAGSGLSGLAGAVGVIWLSIHQVPLTMNGVTLGVLPLLPTLLVVAGTAGIAGSAGVGNRTPRELGGIIASAIAGPLLVTAMALAVVMDGSSVLPVRSPDALTAFAATIALHGAAAVSGVVWRRRFRLYQRFEISAADRRGVRYGAVAAVALLTAGALVVTLRLVMQWSTVAALFAGGNDFDGYLGLFGLSVLYLPNVIVGAASILVGADVHVGTAGVELLTVTPGAVPPLPILGVLPGTDAGKLGALGFLVPALIGLVVGWRCRHADPLTNVRTVAVAGAVAAALLTICAALSGGALGELGSAGPAIAATGVYTLGWVVGLGLLIAVIYGLSPSTRALRAQGIVDDEEELWIDVDTDPTGFDDDYITDHITDGDLDDFTDDAPDEADVDLDAHADLEVTDQLDVDDLGTAPDADDAATDSRPRGVRYADGLDSEAYYDDAAIFDDPAQQYTFGQATRAGRGADADTPDEQDLPSAH